MFIILLICNFFNDKFLSEVVMELKCRKCGGLHIIKNGKVFGWQRYKCKQCGYQFSKTAPAGKSVHIKLIAHGLYVAGLSMREIASIIGVTAQSVSRWIRKWHLAYMSEIGSKETMFKTSKSSLDYCLDIKENDDLLVSTTVLPSGAKLNIIIQLPQKH